MSNLVYLDISGNVKLVHISGLSFCPLLETLLMSNCPLITAYPDCELHNPNLKELSFTVTNTSQVNISNLPHLTRLSLFIINNVTIPLISNSLTCLVLYLRDATSSTIKMPNLSSLPNLSELYFNNKYQDTFIFPHLPLLQLLSFCNCDTYSINVSNLNLTTLIVKSDRSLTNIIGLEIILI